MDHGSLEKTCLVYALSNHIEKHDCEEACVAVSRGCLSIWSSMKLCALVLLYCKVFSNTHVSFTIVQMGTILPVIPVLVFR